MPMLLRRKGRLDGRNYYSVSVPLGVIWILGLALVLLLYFGLQMLWQ